MFVNYRYLSDARFVVENQCVCNVFYGGFYDKIHHRQKLPIALKRHVGYFSNPLYINGLLAWHTSCNATVMNNLGIQASQTLSLLEETQGIKRTSNVSAAKNDAEIDKAAKDFSAVMITQLLKIMFEGIEVDPNFGGGHGEETWRSVLLDEYGKKIGNQGGFGLADMVKAQLLKNQEVRV